MAGKREETSQHPVWQQRDLDRGVGMNTLLNLAAMISSGTNENPPQKVANEEKCERAEEME